MGFWSSQEFGAGPTDGFERGDSNLDKMAKSLRMYEAGAAALARACPELERGYMCPLCLDIGPEDGVRTRPEDGDWSTDHPPPKGVGGNLVVLTCKACNDRDGSSLDHEMSRTQRQRAWASGNQPDYLPARLTVEGRVPVINVETSHAGGCLRISGLPRNNSPATTEQHWYDLDGLSEGKRLKFVLRDGFNPRRAAIGWLRAAYLISFAAFGYTYILRPQLEVVRRQIADPDNVHIERFSCEGSVESDDALMLVDEPPALKCVLVRMGTTVVFLPGHGDHDVYDELRRSETWPPNDGSEVRGELVPWPEDPRFLLDQQSAGAVRRPNKDGR